MKLTTTLLALFLLSALTSLPPSTTAETVLDIDGNPLSNGGTYFILPVFRGMGGGIERAITGNETCPLTVVQSPYELSNGLPIIISSPFKIGIINEGLPLEFSFTFVPLCSPTPSKWTIVKAQPEGWSVKLTGYVDTEEGWFYIEKYNLDHKLVFCSLSTDACANIGIHIDDDGNRHLVLTQNNPFVVQFKIASSSAA